jgi:tetratricopeptide (TPR) repeat protein
VKFVVALAVIFGLLGMGWQGRNRARLQGRVQDLAAVRAQLQAALEEEHLTVAPWRSPGSTNQNAERLRVSDSTPLSLATTLKAKLDQLAAEYSPSRLSPEQSWEIRLGRAACANAEQRFTEALAIVSEQDEKPPPTPTAVAQQLGYRQALQIRADASFGLRNWTVALERYLALGPLDSNDLATLQQVVNCYRALGQTNQMLAASSELAQRQQAQGDGWLFLGRIERAANAYDQAAQIRSWLVDQASANPRAPGPVSELVKSLWHHGFALLLRGTPQLALTKFDEAIRRLERGGEDAARSAGVSGRVYALSHQYRGDALLALGQTAAANEAFAQAVNLLSRIPEESRSHSELVDLAIACASRANAWLIQGQSQPATNDLDRAIKLLEGAYRELGRPELARDGARAHNNRGVAYRLEANPNAALAEFEQAIATLTSTSASIAATNRAGSVQPGFKDEIPGRQDVMLIYTENALEALVRNRPAIRTDPTEAKVELAITHRNRAYARWVLGQSALALSDLETTTRLMGKLVRQDGKPDLAFQLAKAASEVAWILSTSGEPSLRNGRRAEELALQAGELTQWKSHLPLEALAAAQAENGMFAEAVRWQERALGLAPAKNHAELEQKLNLYRAGKPFRSGIAPTSTP